MNLTELKLNYDNYLELNYTSEATISNYKRCFEKFISENSRIYRISNQDLKGYFIKFKSRYSISYYNQMLASLTIIFKILGQPFKLKEINYLKDQPKQISILSKKEITDSLNNIDNLKHKCIIKRLYLGALRISELQNIKLSDIDSKNNRINITKGKGGRGRYVPITDEDIQELYVYYKQFKPEIYLFEGRIKGKKYSQTSIRKVVQKIRSNKRIYPHLLRHTSLTNLVDLGHNHLKIMNLSGHTNPKSLERYYHLSNSALQDMNITLTQY